MKDKDELGISFKNVIPNTEASIKKARLVSDIIEKAENNDEEENKGRS